MWSKAALPCSTYYRCKRTLEKSRLLLHIDYRFEQLPEVLRKLPPEGLLLAISNQRIRSDAECRDFISTQWKC